MAAAKVHLVMELRRSGIRDLRVLEALERVPREMFVPAPFRAKAYDNVTLPIGRHQTVSQPEVVALMTQALDVGDRMKVLEVGTGSGYQTSILARLARRVFTIERHRELLRDAERRFADLRLSNVVTLAGDGSRGWPEQAPFDRIMVTAAAHDVPPVLVAQMALGGIMVVPVGYHETEEHADHDQRLVKVVRTEEGYETEDLGPVRFVPLVAGLALS
ncbi:MAG: protein-L-isoaspartate(D-aspartate) O-methyltransferase [Magnetospirillum sp. WYHS-4]